MVLGGDRPKGTKEFLRCILRAWYDLTQHAARNFASGGASSEQQLLETPEQIEHLILSVLFVTWKLRTLNPCAREQRHRAISNSQWVQRMVSPISALGEGVSSDSESGAVLALLKDSRDGHPLGSRYMRVCTIPPDRIRYGRSPATPAPPIPTPPRHVARSRTTARSAVHRSSRPGTHGAKHLSAVSTYPNEALPNGHIDLLSGALEKDEDSRQHSTVIGHGASLDSVQNHGSSGSGSGGDRDTCPLSWDDMNPWEQRNAYLLMYRDGGAKPHASEESSISAEVLREVSKRLAHHARLEARQRNALALSSREVGVASNSYYGRLGKQSRKGKKCGPTRAAGSGTNKRNTELLVGDPRGAILGFAPSSRLRKCPELDGSWL